MREHFVMPAMIANIISLAALFVLIVYRILILIAGQRIQDRITLRPIASAGFPWENYPVMQLLRRPRDIVRFRSRAFLRTRIQSECILAIGVFSFSAAVATLLYLS